MNTREQYRQLYRIFRQCKTFTPDDLASLYFSPREQALYSTTITLAALDSLIHRHSKPKENKLHNILAISRTLGKSYLTRRS